MGSFIFLGPSGVGKTNFQGACRVPFRHRGCLINFDMSEYMEKHRSVAS